MYFTQVVGIRPELVGLGLSVAGAVSLLSAIPLGVAADRIGVQRAWVLGALAEAFGFLLYPFARGFWAFLALVAVIALATSLGTAGRGAYTISVFPKDVRVRMQAYMRSAFNVGFTAGAGLAAITLALPSRGALYGLVLAHAVGALANAVMVSRMPAVPRTAGATGRPRVFAVLRDRPAVALSALGSIFLMHSVIFAEVVPLWAVTQTDMPRPVLGLLFAVNTLMVVALQVPLSRLADSIRGAARLLRWGAYALVIACPVLALSGRTSGWVTVGLLVLGIVLVTVCEIWQSAAFWAINSEVPPPERRGEYMGLFRLGGGISQMLAPGALTALAIMTGGWGWWVIAALYVGASTLVQPILTWIERTPRLGAPESVTGDAGTP